MTEPILIFLVSFVASNEMLHLSAIAFCVLFIACVMINTYIVFEATERRILWMHAGFCILLSSGLVVAAFSLLGLINK
jgi:hypothetical protein